MLNSIARDFWPGGRACFLRPNMGSFFFFFFLTLQIVMCWVGNHLFIRRQNYKLALEFFHSFLKLFFFPCILKRYHPLRTDNDP